MRHITDGELHAYLDGALDHLTGGRGDEVREHLETCSACRERLQDEEGIRERAQGLLDLSVPGEIPLPSFEELRARAEASGDSGSGQRATPPRRGLLRGVPLAWAATVVLALGVGWMGGQLWESPRQGTLYRSESVDPVFRNEAEQRPAPEEGVAVGGLEQVERDSEVPAPVSSDAVDVVSTPGVVSAERTGPAVGQTAPPAAAAGVPGVDSPQRALELLEARQKTISEPPPGPGARRDAVATEAANLPPPSPAAADPAVTPTVLYRTRGAIEEGSMLVPGLEVVDVDWEEWVPGERALHIRQLLPMGDTLELRYLGLLMGSDPDAAAASVAEGRVPEEEGVERPLSPKVLEASLPPGWNQVVMRWGRGWLVARAPLPVESLRGILRSMR
jgi:anti-sigma factor RsiW